MARRSDNLRMLGKLLVVTLGMFCLWLSADSRLKAICEATGVNILSLTERQVLGNGVAADEARALVKNTQVDTTRTITNEFDANARGPGSSSRPSAACR